MKKLVPIMVGLFASLAGAPLVSAAITTDFATYAAPATVNYSGFSGGPDLVVYDVNSPSDAACVIGGPATSGNLYTQCQAHSTAPNNTFDNAHASDYELIQASSAHCGTNGGGAAITLSACLAANTNSADHALFSITGGGGGGGGNPYDFGGATSTQDQTQKNFAVIYFVFFANMLFIIWLFRRSRV